MVNRAQSVPRPSEPGETENRKEFQDCFRQYFPRLTRYFSRFGFSRSDAEDLSQAALLSVYKSWDHFRGEGSVDAWIFRIARNAATDEWRRRARTPQQVEVPVALADGLPAADAVVSVKETTIMLIAAMRRLPTGMRACLLLQVQQGLSYKEIAERLSLSAHTVKVQIWNARKRLKNVVEGA